MKHQQVEDISNLYNSIYEEKSEEQLIAEFAADYFCEYGLNEDGIDILIEDVGLDNFIEFVYALSEDCEHLVEARSARRRSGGKSYEEVKAEIDAKEAAKEKAKARKKEESKSETKSSDTEAKEKQPKKRPVRDSIAKHILRGMERHNRAMDLAKKTIATAKKAASVAAEGERRAAHHIRKHGLKSLANEEAIISRFRQNIEERYAGRHGQTSAEYKDDRSQGGKMVSGDSKQSGAEYTHGRRVKAENPGSQPDEGGKTKPKSQGRMDSGTRADLDYRKANLKAKSKTTKGTKGGARRGGGGMFNTIPTISTPSNPGSFPTTVGGVLRNTSGPISPGDMMGRGGV